MRAIEILKRVVPFTAAALAGVVAVGLIFGFPSSTSTYDGQDRTEQLTRELRRLKAENCRLKAELRRAERADFLFDGDLTPPSPPAAPESPAPPAPPAAPKAPAFR